MDYSDDQLNAINHIIGWFESSSNFGHKQYLTLGGLAGTGKTTIIGNIENLIPDLRVTYCALSGKATQMIRSSLEARGIATTRITVNENEEQFIEDKVCTIHSLIYSPLELYHCGCNNCEIEKATEGNCPHPAYGPNGYPIIDVVYRNSDRFIDADLIILDEASMVNGFIWNDLRNLNIPILAVGDHGQLPPIGDSFNLMEEPDIVLERIHRQAADDPILNIAYQARNVGRIEPGEYGSNVRKVAKPESFKADPVNTMVICGFRRTRNELNTAMRRIHGFTSPLPQVGERVICLRNVRAENVYNGMMGIIKEIGYTPGLQMIHQPEFVSMTIRMDTGKLFVGRVWLPQFGKDNTTNENITGGTLWDYGYAITCHKAQGSESDDVVVFEEPFGDEDSRKRWLYTAVTRAKKSLLVIGQ